MAKSLMKDDLYPCAGSGKPYADKELSATFKDDYSTAAVLTAGLSIKSAPHHKLTFQHRMQQPETPLITLPTLQCLAEVHYCFNKQFTTHTTHSHAASLLIQA